MLGIAKGTGKRIVESVLDAIPEDWRPTTLDPYGCGSYGCVYPTSDPAIVLKATTDPTEVAFVQIAQQLHGPNGFPAGIVRYYRIDATTETYRGRLAYLIWRESAFDVGNISAAAMAHDADPYLRRTAMEAYKYMSMYMGYAKLVREAIQRSDDPLAFQVEAARYADWAWNDVNWEDGVNRIKSFRGGRRFAAAEHAALGTAQMLGSTYLFNYVGEALEFYQDQGLMLADVHSGNIGRVIRPDYGDIVVITDPGHLVQLTTYYKAAGKL